MTYLKKWPPFWRDDGQGNKIKSWKYVPLKVEEAEQLLQESDIVLRDLTDVVLELRANADNLEDIIKRIREEGDA